MYFLLKIAFHKIIATLAQVDGSISRWNVGVFVALHTIDFAHCPGQLNSFKKLF